MYIPTPVCLAALVNLVQCDSMITFKNIDCITDKANLSVDDGGKISHYIQLPATEPKRKNTHWSHCQS